MERAVQGSDVSAYVRQVKGSPRFDDTRFVGGEPIIRVDNVHKFYGEHHVLKGISLEVEPGDVLVVMGPSGCGKSTLLKCIIGAHTPEVGSISIDNEPIVGASEHQLNAVRKRFGVLFQSSALFSSMTVGENVALPLLQHTDLPASTIEIIVRIKLEMVGLGHAFNLIPSELSGGMKKRAGLARAIALDPSIVFYDEPSAGLDPIVVGIIDKLIVDLTRKLRITSVVVTHEMRSAFRIADKMVLLDRGRVVAAGTPDELRANNDPRVVQFVSGNAEGPMATKPDDVSVPIAERLLGPDPRQAGNPAGPPPGWGAPSR
jgi:phospholipid/cholesterol/gamma-HCH transport system ATP-binding protein